MSAAIPTATETPLSAGTEIARVPMTFEAFLSWDHEQYHGGLAEWIHGEAHVYLSATELHQRIAEFLLTLLRLVVRAQHAGRVIGVPYAMQAVTGGSGREPDVMFLTNDHLDRLGPTRLQGPPDLVVVVSDDSPTRDRSDKLGEYQAANIPEYWVIDPRPGRRRVDFYQLNTAATYRPGPVQDGIYHSPIVPGFWLRIDWLWQDDPDSLLAAGEIVGPERLLGRAD
jgi:Uma2 family endonuclease